MGECKCASCIMRRGEPWLVGYVARKAGVTEEAVMEAVNARGRPLVSYPSKATINAILKEAGLDA